MTHLIWQPGPWGDGYGRPLTDAELETLKEKKTLKPPAEDASAQVERIAKRTPRRRKVSFDVNPLDN